jgi:CO/xanthine dehydrogenase Mo-binding subunit
MASVGTSVARKEGMDRATGAAKYADDLRFPGMLLGRTIRSTIARGRVTGVALGFETAGFTVVDHRDIPGENTIALIEKDQPCLVNGTVRHAAEPILLLAHERREALVAADIRIEYEREEPLFDPARSEQVFKHILIEKGNLERGFARAEVVVEGTYATGAQEHVYIETNGVIAVP